MYVFPSVKDFTKLMKTGSILVVPSELLKLLSGYLNPLKLGSKEDEKLVKAPFYVLPVPDFVPVQKTSRSGWRFKLRAEAKLSAPGNQEEVGKVAAEYEKKHSDEVIEIVNMLAPDGSLANVFIKKISETIENLYRKHRRILAGKPIFLYYGPEVDPRIVELLMEVGLVSGVPTYVMIPINLDRVDVRFIDAIMPFAKRGEVGFLLGIEPKPVRVKIGKEEVELPVAHFLIRNAFKLALGVEEDPLNHYAMAADFMILRIFERAGVEAGRAREMEDKMSVSTVLLNALYLELVEHLKTHLEEYPYDTMAEVVRDMYEYAHSRALDQRRNLVKYAKLLGATKEAVQAIESTGWVFEPRGFAESWGAEIVRRKREEERLEEVLSG